MSLSINSASCISNVAPLPQPVASPASAAKSVVSQAIAPVNPHKLKNSVDAINKFLQTNNQMQFSIDEDSGFSVVKVIDTETQKILRQFPSEQALEIGKSLQKSKGLLIDSKA